MKNYFLRIVAIVFIAILIVLTAGYLMPEKITIPVQDALEWDWNHKTFWYYPWGASIVHKGIDIFANAGTPVLAATGGFVLSAKWTGIGGNVVYILGPKWRIHYYAHLKDIQTDAGCFVFMGDQIGTVGNSGNASGVAPHLHYSIQTPIPYVWRWSDEIQGWKKMFYLNPHKRLIDLARAKTQEALTLVKRLAFPESYFASRRQLLIKGKKAVPGIRHVLKKVEQTDFWDAEKKDQINLLRNALIVLGKIGGERSSRELIKWRDCELCVPEIHAAAELGIKLLHHPAKKESDYPDLYQSAIASEFRTENHKR